MNAFETKAGFEFLQNVVAEMRANTEALNKIAETIEASTEPKELSAPKHAFWAPGPYDDDIFETAEKESKVQSAADGTDLITFIGNEIVEDDGKRPVRLIASYRDAPQDVRNIVDAVLIMLSGYGMKSLVERWLEDVGYDMED